MKRLVFAACLFAAAAASADTTPVMFSLFTPVQAPSRSYDVAGFRLSLLYGDCKGFASGRVRGCQIGLFNYAEEMERGMQIGIVNVISRNGWLPVLPIVNGRF